MNVSLLSGIATNQPIEGDAQKNRDWHLRPIPVLTRVAMSWVTLAAPIAGPAESYPVALGHFVVRDRRFADMASVACIEQPDKRAWNQGGSCL